MADWSRVIYEVLEHAASKHPMPHHEEEEESKAIDQPQVHHENRSITLQLGVCLMLEEKGRQLAERFEDHYPPSPRHGSDSERKDALAVGQPVRHRDHIHFVNPRIFGDLRAHSMPNRVFHWLLRCFFNSEAITRQVALKVRPLYPLIFASS